MNVNLDIPNVNEISDVQIKPIDKLLKCIANEFKNTNFKNIINEYDSILSYFYNYTAPFRKAAPKYGAMLMNTINKLCAVYNLKLRDFLVHVDKHSKNDWGNLYWSFLHYTSILIAYAYEENLILDVLNFPSIVYNINEILPCQQCIHHYMAIKESDEIKTCIKYIAYGYVMSGLQQFHRLITKNVESTPEYANIPKQPYFSVSDYAMKYKCIELQNEKIKLSESYIRNSVDLQTETHVLLTTLLITYFRQPYGRGSNLLKHNVYINDENFKSINMHLKSRSEIVPSSIQEIIFDQLHSKQIKYVLVKALLMQRDNNILTHESIYNVDLCQKTILLLYKKFPDVIMDLLDTNLPTSSKIEELPNSDDTENVFNEFFKPTRKSILLMLEATKNENNLDWFTYRSPVKTI